MHNPHKSAGNAITGDILSFIKSLHGKAGARVAFFGDSGRV